jgi:transposase InsO family protein
MLLTDDYTGRHFGYLLRSKDLAGQALQIFIQQAGRPAHIRADNGGEFISEQAAGFMRICREHAIRQSFSLPDSYQQNGVAERSHRIIIETTRALLISARLPVTFWSYAYRHAVYLTGYLVGSRRPLSPYELWFGSTPSVSHLRCWGSRVTYKPPEAPGKLAPVGHRSIFLGYVQGAHDDKPQGIIVCDQESLEPKIVYTNDFEQLGALRRNLHLGRAYRCPQR